MFWLIDDVLFAYPFDGSYPEGTAKSGDTYNHKKLWDIVRPKGCSKSFDYYPRGRVELSGKGKAVIFMSTHIGEKYMEDIKTAFELSGEVIVKYDHSRHYNCYLYRQGGDKK